MVEKLLERQYVADTDNGQILKRKIGDLELLLKAYRNGELRENAEK